MAPRNTTLRVRVLEASTVDRGGPVRIVLSGLEDPVGYANQVSNGGGQAEVTDGRVDALGVLARLVDAGGRTGGRPLADELGDRLRSAVAAWRDGPLDLVTPAGVLPLATRPVVMGIVNVTPDSFSDGGQFEDVDAAVVHGRRLLAEGADLLDVGGESTRPGAAKVPAKQELARVLPVIEALAGDGAIISIDTSKSKVAQAAVRAGASMVNDVQAASKDKEMLDIVAALGVAYVAMHARGTPKDMQDDPTYADVVAEVFDHLADVDDRAVAAGIAPELMILDPGIGFGKTVQHNLVLLRALTDLRSLGRPIMLGASRKSFLGALTGVERADDRRASSVAAAVLAVQAGASILRVHDVAATVQAVQVATAVRVGEPVAWGSHGLPT